VIQSPNPDVPRAPIGRAELLRGSGGVLALNVGGAAVSFLTQFVLARGLGAEQFGLYALALSWVFFLVLVSRLGLDGVLLRFGASYRARGELGYLSGLIKWVAGVVLGLSGLCAVALLVGAGLVLGSTPAFPCFIVAAALVPLLALLQTNKSILLALGHPVVALFQEQVLRTALLLIAVLSAGAALGLQLSATFVMMLATSSTLVALVVGIAWLCARLPTPVWTTPGRYSTSEWVAVSVSLGIVTAAEAVSGRADVMILGLYRPSGDVGVYAAALTVTSVLEFLIGALTFVLAPKFAELHAQGRLEFVQRLLTRSIVVLLAVTVPTGVGIVLFGSDIMGIFGKDFSGGHGVLPLLVASQLVVPFTGPVGVLLSMLGQHRPFAWAAVITTLANLLLLVALVSVYGVLGAAPARFCAAMIRCTVLGIIAWLRIGIMPTPFAPVLASRLRSVRTS